MSDVNNILIIERATRGVAEAVAAVIIGHMAAVLTSYPVADLASDNLCETRLSAAGFPHHDIFRLGSEARFAAWQTADPNACRDAYRNWLFHTRKVATPATMFARH